MTRPVRFLLSNLALPKGVSVGVDVDAISLL